MPPMPGDGASLETVEKALRQRRAAVALVLGLADLSGEADLWQTVETLSDFADEAADRALNAVFADRHGGEDAAGFAVIGLGKLGSRELNYSSDIDPILIFDPDILPRRQRDDPTEAATRLARRWVEALSARTGDGYVMRVDLRLRPSPEVTPIALPVDAAISYYESQALAWEQAAFIRARTVAGDQALGARFLKAIAPFVWRSVRDFGQLSRIADMSARIRDHYSRGQLVGPGFDVKRGRGGIREVEFFVQSQQLIHGGRDPSLRSPSLRVALPALVAAGHVGAGAAELMLDHYVTLRTIEHRLQMVDDQQTHSIPDAPAAIDGVARLHGLNDGAALLEQVRQLTGEVASRFDDLLAGLGQAEGWPLDEAALHNAVTATGYPDPEDATRRILQWRGGGQRVLRSPAAREALELVLPPLITAFAAAPVPQETLARFDALVDGLPSAVNLFHMLRARPILLDHLVAILSHAPTLADALSQRAELLEGLIDASAFATSLSRDVIETRLRRAPANEAYEALLDRIRRETGELRFAIGAQLVEGVVDPLDASRGYGQLAETALGVLTDATIAEFEAAHGRIAGGELLILALGRFGGGALTHASDLDLIYLFTGDHLAESDGTRPLGATVYFNRLAQRVTAALSVPTAAGSLYEVDTRLRPQGAQGPLVCSVDSFARYQREDAWAWEHMALTRARAVYGSAAAREAVAQEIDAVLHRDRDEAQFRRDVARMRRDLHAHKPPGGPLDVKLGDGGLVDFEFCVHLLQLTHRCAFSPDLDVAIAALVERGLATAAHVNAGHLLSRMLVALRLMSRNSVIDAEDTRARVAHCCGQADWRSLLAAQEAAQRCISQWVQQLKLDDCSE